MNAPPHLGHAYTTIVTDAICRYKRLVGEDVRFQTGTDEHGDKIAQAANDAHISPRAYVDRISAMFRDTWPLLSIQPDTFIRTTDEKHIKTVQAILQKVYDQDDIYFSEYAGLYCRGCERFLTEKELVGGKCPDHQTAPEEITEQNYFFRMSKYQDWLIDHINSNPDFITPEGYRNEVLAFLKEPLEDLCISRPTSRLTWGIPLPFDKNFVTYVWFDALINYLTGIGYPDGADFHRYWSAAEHVIAKDILKPHAIFWPTMLKAIGLPIYKKLHVHGYWNINETKMSKSLGNVVRPVDLVAEYGADVVRYFLLREMSFGVDASFSPEAIVTRQTSDLANDLGNLFSRSLTMVKNFAASKVPHPGPAEKADTGLVVEAEAMLADYNRHMEEFQLNRALQSVWKVISHANKYIVVNAPWELAKDPDQRKRLDTVLYTILEALRLIALTIFPFMPETAEKMRTALGDAADPDLKTRNKWGLLEPGTTITLGKPLFPRLIPAQEGTNKQEGQGKKGSKKQADPPQKAEPQHMITFDDFTRLDLRVAEIIAAEKIEKSDRLLKLTVKVPEERTVVAGIAESYSPAEVIGKRVILVANLKPAKLMGVTSHGMVLAAKDGDKLVLSTIYGDAPPGCKVS